MTCWEVKAILLLQLVSARKCPYCPKSGYFLCFEHGPYFCLLGYFPLWVHYGACGIQISCLGMPSRIQTKDPRTGNRTHVTLHYQGGLQVDGGIRTQELWTWESNTLNPSLSGRPTSRQWDTNPQALDRGIEHT